MNKILIIILLLLSHVATAEILLPDQRLFSVGDLHGDLEALKNILDTMRLYSRTTNQWIGGNANLVILGDVVDRGPNSRELMDFIIKLEKESILSGGKVHTLLGNHELMLTMSVLNDSNPNDMMAFNDFKDFPDQDPREALVNAFSGSSKYAEWNRTKKTILQINGITFVHAGFEDWVFQFSINQVNQMVTSWLMFFQGVGPKPDPATRWVIENKGPLWSRRFAQEINNPKIKKMDIDHILRHLNSSRIAVGHTSIHNLKMAIHHPYYNGKILFTDTGISNFYDKIISIFEYKNNGEVIAHQISRNRPKIIDTIHSPIKLTPNDHYLSCKDLL